MSLSRQIKAVRLAEARVDQQRDQLERSGRRLAKRARRLLMPHGLLVGGVLAGAIADRWLFPPSPGGEATDGDRRNMRPDANDNSTGSSFIAEIGSLLAIANSLTPLAMQAMTLHQRWQAARPPGDAAPEAATPQSTDQNAAGTRGDAPDGASA